MGYGLGSNINNGKTNNMNGGSGAQGGAISESSSTTRTGTWSETGIRIRLSDEDDRTKLMSYTVYVVQGRVQASRGGRVIVERRALQLHSLCQPHGGCVGFGLINWQFQGNHKVVSSPNCQISIDELSAVCQGRLPHCIDEVTNEVSNSPARRDGRRQVSLPHSSAAALAPPSFSGCPGSSILIDCCSEGSSTADNHPYPRTGKKLTHLRRRTSLRNIPQRLLSAES